MMILVPGKVLAAMESSVPLYSAGRSTANHWAGLWRAGKRGSFLFREHNGLHARLFIVRSGDAFKSRLILSKSSSNGPRLIGRRIWRRGPVWPAHR
jgi:hypothetical protein